MHSTIRKNTCSTMVNCQKLKLLESVNLNCKEYVNNTITFSIFEHTLFLHLYIWFDTVSVRYYAFDTKITHMNHLWFTMYIHIDNM